MRKFKHWIHLNKEGKEEYGEIFPKGEVPVLSMIPQIGHLGTLGNIQSYFVVQWDELEKDQQEAIIKKICKKFNAKPGEVKKMIAESGLPIRQSMTIGSGTNHPGFFT